MNALSSFVERHRTLLLAVTALWTMAGVVLYAWAPLTVPILLLLSIVAPAAWYLAGGHKVTLQWPSPVILALALAGAYLAINTTWSLSPGTARPAVVMLFLFIVTLHFTPGALEESDVDVLKAMSIGLWAGLVIAGLILCVEALSHQWTRRTLMTFVPSLRPNVRDLQMREGWVIYLQPFLINRSIAALTFLFWPALLAVVLTAQTQRQQRWLLLGLVPVAAAVMASQHATSKIAFVGSAAAFAAFYASPALTRRAIVWLWVATVALAVPLAMLAYKNELYLARWMPQSAKHRIVIWGHTAELFAKAPILGAGIHTARALHDPNDHDAPVAPGSDIRVTTGLHSHNGYLQTWYEAGAVGAIFLLALGLLLLRSLATAPPEVQPYLYATFVAGALAGGSSFSVWQPWFMASFGYAAVFAALGWTLAEKRQSSFSGKRTA